VELGRTSAVNMLVVGEVAYLFNVRYFTASAFTRDIFTDNLIALWMAAFVMVFQLAFTFSTPLQQLFQTTPLEAVSWLMILALRVTELLAAELEKAMLRYLNLRNF
jgi:magnesium-transporting ATPase (P-type)